MAILSAQQKGGFSYIEKAAGSRYQSRCDVRETDCNRDKTGTKTWPTHLHMRLMDPLLEKIKKLKFIKKEKRKKENLLFFVPFLINRVGEFFPAIFYYF